MPDPEAVVMMWQSGRGCYRATSQLQLVAGFNWFHHKNMRDFGAFLNNLQLFQVKVTNIAIPGKGNTYLKPR